MGIVYSQEHQLHQTGSHPENPGRLEVIMDYLKDNGILEELEIYEPIKALEEDLLRVHTSEHLKYLDSFAQKGGGYLDFDTYLAPQSYEIAKLAAGGTIKASQLVLNDYDTAYSMVRPPGHHATSTKAMGFCLINNLAVALEYLRANHNMKKFFILDFDAHYGNGTADIFYQDPNVLYISMHQDPRTIFPGKGFIEEMGQDEGKGFNMNFPMPPGSNTSDYIYILEKILEPLSKEFKADFHFLDVGFDGHREDPLSSLQLDDDFYPWVAGEMKKLSTLLVLVLEGGYSYDAMGRSNLKMINVLKDENSTYKEKREELTKNLQVKDEVKNIFCKVQDNFSPFFKF